MPVILICFLMLMFGCATGPNDGTKPPPPSPLEAKILAQTIMAVAIHSQKMDPVQIEKMMSIFKDARSTVQLAMAKDPTNVEPITLDYVSKLDPVYQQATKGMLQIFIIRLRPYTTQGPEGQAIAVTYIDAVFDGAVLACEQALGKKPGPPGVDEPELEDARV